MNNGFVIVKHIELVTVLVFNNIETKAIPWEKSLSFDLIQQSLIRNIDFGYTGKDIKIKKNEKNIVFYISANELECF